MIIFDCTVGKRRGKLGLSLGKPFRHLAIFILLVEPTVCAVMLLVPEGNVLAFQGTRWKIVPIGLMGVNPNLISLVTKMSLALCCYPMLNFTVMIMGFIPITPLINVGIYVCNYAIARHSNTPLRRILVFQLVTLRRYCWMGINCRVSLVTFSWKCRKTISCPTPNL